MYRQSIYKSPPQTVLVAASGTAAITAVDPNYSRITPLGFESNDTTGAVAAARGAVRFNSGTQVAEFTGAGACYVLIEEFRPSDFLQAFQHGTVTIAASSANGSHAHGLTLGPKASVFFRGSTSNRTADGGLALTEAMVAPTLHLNGATVDAFNAQFPYAGGDGTIDCYYTLVDPK